MAWSEETRIGESDAGELIRRGAREQLDGNLDKAESLFRDAEGLLTAALERSENDAGTKDELPIILRELSRLYILQSAPALAEPPLRRLLAITEAQDPGGSEVATVLASLAAVRHSLGDYASAEQLYRQALTIRETTLAPNHVTTAATMESLAESCAARGRFTEAVALCNRALSIREVTLGGNDASVRVARKRISGLQMEAHEESRVTTPPRATPVQSSSPNVDAVTLEERASGSSSRPRSSLGPWTDELTAVQEELEATLPAVDERGPARISGAIAPHAPRTTVVGIAAGIVVLLLVLGVKQFGSKPERNTFVEAEPYNPAARVAIQQAVASPVAAPTPPTTRDTLTVAATKVVAGTKPAASLESRAAPAKASAGELRRPTPSTTSAPVVRAPPVVDSAPTRTAATPVEKPPEPRARAEVNAPTSPTLIGAAPQPAYPEALREQQVEGEVVVQFVVDETGRPDVSSMTVVRSPHVLLTNALRAVLPQFRFEPARTAPPQSTPRPETVRYAFTFRAPRR